MKKIYLDHSATTPTDQKVIKKMLPYFDKTFGNASSIHSFGQDALNAVDDARRKIAGFLNCDSQEIIFTSGATESDNLAIKGVLSALPKSQNKKIHIITSLIEHDAVLEPCMEMEKSGLEVSYVKVDKSGIVDLKYLESLIKENTALVSIMYVNSEIGSIMPIREIGKMIYKINEKRLNNWKKIRPKERGKKPQPIYFHTDATQAVNFCNCDVKWNYIDLLSMSGHKIYGPKGVGVLYKKTNIPLKALQKGGHHENDLRSGTLNVPGIVGMGEAVALLGKTQTKGKLTKIQIKNNKKLSKLRDYFVSELQKKVPDIVLNTERSVSTPSHAHFSIIGVEGEALLISLDLAGIAVSTGSACASGSLKASHVLLAMGIDKEIAHYSIRFTLGKNNTKKEIDATINILKQNIERLRNMNPIYKK